MNKHLLIVTVEKQYDRGQNKFVDSLRSPSCCCTNTCTCYNHTKINDSNDQHNLAKNCITAAHPALDSSHTLQWADTCTPSKSPVSSSSGGSGCPANTRLNPHKSALDKWHLDWVSHFVQLTHAPNTQTMLYYIYKGNGHVYKMCADNLYRNTNSAITVELEAQWCRLEPGHAMPFTIFLWTTANERTCDALLCIRLNIHICGKIAPDKSQLSQADQCDKLHHTHRTVVKGRSSEWQTGDSCRSNYDITLPIYKLPISWPICISCPRGATPNFGTFSSTTLDMSSGAAYGFQTFSDEVLARLSVQSKVNLVQLCYCYPPSFWFIKSQNGLIWPKSQPSPACPSPRTATFLSWQLLTDVGSLINYFFTKS